MKKICIIPARYKSTRFPGKPLVDICGKPMIYWVYKNCVDAEIFDDIIVATDDIRILDQCKQLGIRSLMTSDRNRTGTDRVGEVAKSIDADIFINVQGDEPALKANVIKQVLTPFSERETQVANLMTEIKVSSELINSTIPKVVTNQKGTGVFLSRSPIPYPKGELSIPYYKQIGVYAFTKEALMEYYDYGIKFGKSKLESYEDIEILRFIELGIPVKYITVETESISVDTYKDLEKVRILLQTMGS